MKFTLTHGIPLEDELQVDVETRELTTQDLIDAEMAAERLVFDSQGNPALVTSQVLFNYELLRRQIKCIGKIPSPVSLKILGKLNPEDLNLINAMLTTQEQAKVSKVIDQRGRVEATDKNA
ncbi:Mu-like prophage FluMu protein gp41 [[Actinobacillus] rossii]|uniref:Mu-like prophage FluMu protein gp41 n=1 Tax=[Actinobacillus] rossii TaxID=123820 RepID=A0A380TPF2_9PAST|nr:Mu-like prophage FluMu protein gp41 [[Actinobacillus] rossii]